ncbi:MAG TPA: hypothetical protein VMV26_17630 [Alphaproteobacteria bacterium]|jgi:hypothetical protein|nr:hypothetical protein [Alphaproteobacteria bacterium]
MAKRRRVAKRTKCRPARTPLASLRTAKPRTAKPRRKPATRRPAETASVLTLDELARRDPIPPTEAMPAALRAMLEPAPAGACYVESERPPALRARSTAIGRGARGRIWQARLEGGSGRLMAGRAGLAQGRFSPTTLARGGRRAASLASHRPAWVTTEFLPRLTPRRRLTTTAVGARAARTDAPVMHTMDAVIEGFAIGWPWHCVGKVQGGFDTDFDRPRTTGTGVLVGRNVLLTAAHLAIWDRGPGQWWMRFFPGWRDGPDPKLGSAFVEEFRGPGPQSNPNSNDFVVCKLYDPLGDALGFFGTIWSSDDDFYYDRHWTSIGYPDHTYGGQRPTFDLDVEVQDIDNNGDGREIEIALNDYLLNGGWSGGPLFGWFPELDPRVIGVCSGWDADGWDPYRAVFAGGGPLINYVHAARQDWS